MLSYLYWLKKHHFTQPRKLTKSFDTITLICTAVGFFDGMEAIRSIFDNEPRVLEGRLSVSDHTYLVNDIQISSLTTRFSCHPRYFEYHIWIDSVCHPLLNRLKGRNTSIILFASIVLLEAFSQTLLVLSLEVAVVVAPWQNTLKWNTKDTIDTKSSRTRKGRIVELNGPVSSFTPLALKPLSYFFLMSRGLHSEVILNFL